MDNSDRPNLGLDVFAQLEREFDHIDKQYWQKLREMQEQTLLSELAYPFLTQKPKPSKRPAQLSIVLRSYAETLFYVEASKYPKLDRNFGHWLNDLARRVQERVMERVGELESSDPMQNLAYHGLTKSQMRQVVHDGLLETIKKWPVPQFPLQRPREEPSDIQTAPTQIVATVASKKRKFSASVFCPSAARKMEEFVQRKGMRLTEFAIQAGTTDRTLRNFRKTGKVKHGIFEGIAKAMGTTREALLSD